MKTDLKNIYILILISVVLGIIFLFVVKSGKKSERSVSPLNVQVKYDKTKFTVTNHDTIDYVNATLTLNEYYKISGINLMAGESYTIWPVEFIHYNGTHFPGRQAPVKFSVWCELNNNRNGFYSKRFR